LQATHDLASEREARDAGLRRLHEI